MEASFHRSEVD